MARRSPATARLDDEGRRLYTWTGRGQVEEFYSVMTILGLGVPKYLVPWASKAVAELAYHDVAEAMGTKGRRRGARAIALWAARGRAYVDELKAGGALRTIDPAKLSDEDFALRYLKGEPDRIRDAAAVRGTDVHTAAEDLVLANVTEALQDGELIPLILDGRRLPEWPESIRPWMENGFVPWVKRYRPRIIATEATVYHRAQQYAGTGDVWVEVLIDGRWERLMVDYKSGNRIYPEVAMQCAAYARGEFIGGPDGMTEQPVPVVDGTAVLHITPKGPDFRRLRYDDVVYTSFLYARETFRWVIETSKTAIGARIEPDLEDVLAASLEAVSA